MIPPKVVESLDGEDGEERRAVSLTGNGSDMWDRGPDMTCCVFADS